MVNESEATQNQQSSSGLGDKLLAAKKTSKTALAAMGIFEVSLLYYPVRLFSSVLLLAAIAGLVTSNESWIGWIDVFGLASVGFVGVMGIAIGINFALSITTFIIANGLFIMSRVNPWQKALGLIIAPVCIAVFCAVPVLSLIEGVWIWLLYVVKSQADKITE